MKVNKGILFLLAFMFGLVVISNLCSQCQQHRVVSDDGHSTTETPICTSTTSCPTPGGKHGMSPFNPERYQ